MPKIDVGGIAEATMLQSAAGFSLAIAGKLVLGALSRRPYPRTMAWRPSVSMLTAGMVTLLALISAPVAAKDALVPQRTQIVKTTACLAHYASTASAGVLARPMYSEEQRQAAETLHRGNDSCLYDKIAVFVRGDIFYGELAAGLIERRPALLDTLAARPSAPPVRPQTGLNPASFVTAFGECLTRAEPAKAAALLRTERDSTAEHDAVLAFGDTLSACTATDVAYHMNIPDLRAHIALSAYRLANGINASAAKG